MTDCSRPVGTGFSQGTPTATDEKDVAQQFMGFFKNFVDTFAMQGYTVYIAGESYAGAYVPYIADGFLNANDTTYYNLSSILVYDGVYSYDSVGEQIPMVPFVNFWEPVFDLNATTLATLRQLHEECGYAAFLEQALVFPPTGPLPTPPNADGSNDTCDVFDMTYNAGRLVNPNLDLYQILTTSPALWDVLGFPGSFDYTPEGADVYFNRSVRKLRPFLFDDFANNYRMSNAQLTLLFNNGLNVPRSMSSLTARTTLHHPASLSFQA